MKANVSVGMPLDVCTLKKDDLELNNQIRFEKNDPYFEKISNSWGEALKKSIKELPPLILNNLDIDPRYLSLTY